MPTVQDTIARLAGSTIFSGVDMAGAFHCIDIDPRDREKTAFATPFGSFQQKRLGFGVTNGPATYCRLVDLVLKNIPDSVAISFLDDGVIHSASLEQHLRNVRRTLAAYKAAGLRLKPEKVPILLAPDHIPGPYPRCPRHPADRHLRRRGQEVEPAAL